MKPKKKKTRAKKPIRRKAFVKLTKEQYYKALQDPKWQKRRLKVFERDSWKCRKCGSKKRMLVVHHLKYTKKYPRNEPMEHLITWCKKCHDRKHNMGR